MEAISDVLVTTLNFDIVAGAQPPRSEAATRLRARMEMTEIWSFFISKSFLFDTLRYLMQLQLFALRGKKIILGSWNTNQRKPGVSY
jgi:hypothetical protein